MIYIWLGMTGHLQWENITITKVNFCEQAIVTNLSNIYGPRAEQESKQYVDDGILFKHMPLCCKLHQFNSASPYQCFGLAVELYSGMVRLIVKNCKFSWISNSREQVLFDNVLFQPCKQPIERRVFKYCQLRILRTKYQFKSYLQKHSIPTFQIVKIDRFLPEKALFQWTA